MDSLHTWGPPIWQTSLDDSIVQGLLEQGNAIRHREEFNAEIDLAMNTHDEWNYPPEVVEWFSKSIKTKVVDYMQIWAKHLGWTYNKWLSDWQIDSLWINYMQKYDCNPLHDHKGSISFIIYLNDVPELKTEKQRMNLTNNGPTPGSACGLFLTFSALQCLLRARAITSSHRETHFALHDPSNTFLLQICPRAQSQQPQSG